MRRLIFVLTLLLGVQASASNSNFIPNYYRNRNELNNYSAIGWSDKRLVEVNGSYERQAQDTNGERVSDETRPGFAAQGYYRLASDVNFEARATNTVSTTNEQSFGQVKATTQNYRASAGYEMTNSTGIPVALGVSVTQTIRDFTNTSQDTITGRTTQVQFGGGYRLANDIFLGLGYSNSRSIGAQIAHQYTVGAGKVFGDKKAPLASVETFLDLSNNNGTPMQGFTGQGLYNFLAFQFYGSLHYLAVQRADRAETHQGVIGADYEFHNFYAGPEVGYFEQSSNDKSSDSEIIPSLEVGYRNAMLEAHLRYGLDRLNESFTGTDFHIDANTTTLGFIYKF